MQNKRRIAIVGGGAAGLLAAICAARNGASPVIIERLDRVGKKILATGNGRCNMTNIYTDISSFHGRNTKFVYGALGQFDVEQTMTFFEGLGIHCKVEDGGKVYPYSDQASSVLDVLRYEVGRLGVEERVEATAVKVKRNKAGYIISLKSGEEIFADKVILAAGGKASPNLGSNGSGYDLAAAFGHKLIAPFPALVQLRLDATFLKAIKGVKFEGEAAVGIGDSILQRERGEILYTDYGISGPPILQLSRRASEQLEKDRKPWIKVDMFPHINEGEFLELLKARIKNAGDKPLDISFIGLINKKLIPILIKDSGIQDIHKPCNEVSKDEIAKMSDRLKGWSFKIVGTQSWTEAQVTAGGIDVADINPKTMESKLSAGLYIAGEILDIDGDCGGFNLQWAWSSGYTAGYHAALD